MPQEQDEKIEELGQKIEELSSRLQEKSDEIDNFMNKINPNNLLNTQLDPSSGRTIISILERTWFATEEIVGAGFTITPQTRYHILTGTASRTSDTTTAINDGIYKGQLLILEGTDNTNTIIIKEGANTNLTGDITLGSEDILTLIWNGSIWVQITVSNN